MQTFFRGVVIALLALGVGVGISTTPVDAATNNRVAAHQLVGVKPFAPVVTTQVDKGIHKTNRYLPKSYKYDFRLPKLGGVPQQVKQKFDRKIKALVAAELRGYDYGAVSKAVFDKEFALVSDQMSAADFAKTCVKDTFKPLKGKYVASVYKGRYVSVVLTFTGLNGACTGLGGLWVEHRTSRSVTFDVVTGQFMKLSDFTSNAHKQVSEAVSRWYNTKSHENWVTPKVGADLKVCDRRGNLMSIVSKLKSCWQGRTKVKSILLAWRVSNQGIHLTFPAGDGPRYAMIAWEQIPRLR
ncbi:MAG: hypothetical protein LBG70_00410 [Bifidobacteriaceae bacterium]|jgi:hypothetical protein|nr:hypothetical protein [Bifidobacteriaceae bacterium]